MDQFRQSSRPWFCHERVEGAGKAAYEAGFVAELPRPAPRVPGAPSAPNVSSVPGLFFTNRTKRENKWFLISKENLEIGNG